MRSSIWHSGSGVGHSKKGAGQFDQRTEDLVKQVAGHLRSSIWHSGSGVGHLGVDIRDDDAGGDDEEEERDDAFSDFVVHFRMGLKRKKTSLIILIYFLLFCWSTLAVRI